MRRLFMLPALALAVAPRLLAQSAPVAPTAPRFGLVAGVNLADLSGSDLSDTKMRPAFMGGAVMVWPFSGNFAFEPELLFTMKGAKATQSNVDVTIKLSYIELPLLLRLDVPASGETKPFVFAGPSLALQTSCDFEGHSQGVTVSLSCEEAFRQAGASIDVKTFDMGALIGGGMAFDVGGRVLSIGVRYDLGLLKIFSDSDTKNRVLSFVGTFEFPLHRK